MENTFTAAERRNLPLNTAAQILDKIKLCSEHVVEVSANKFRIVFSAITFLCMVIMQ